MGGIRPRERLRSKAELVEWIEFRIKHPELGGIRCAACEMRGGLVVSGDAAQAVRELPIMSGQDVEDGAFVSLPACRDAEAMAHPGSEWVKAGRPCPYAVLSPENESAADVVIYARSEHTRGLATEYARELSAAMHSDDRAPFLERVLAALSSRPVVDELYPPIEAANG